MLKVASQSCAILKRATPPATTLTAQAAIITTAAAPPVSTIAAPRAMPNAKVCNPPQSFAGFLQAKDPPNLLSDMVKKGCVLVLYITLLGVVVFIICGAPLVIMVQIAIVSCGT
ncbi:hypothetical protein N5J53_02665 [Empedobacter sp. GD03644]|uniref:hypothetical protein n=1 Tax=unclassified Empedobacter TaxID=2643773 RepID=UPI00244B5A64|nr:MULTISPECIES: hypothetical protein [unclassified Empedobacter]MDH2205904.1 hypothetical protein [Empedobacter sp. GD03644]